MPWCELPIGTRNVWFFCVPLLLLILLHLYIFIRWYCSFWSGVICSCFNWYFISQACLTRSFSLRKYFDISKLVFRICSEESGALPKSWENSKASTSHGNLELGLSQWKVQAVAALGARARELRSIILKVWLLLLQCQLLWLFWWFDLTNFFRVAVCLHWERYIN